MQGLLLGKLNIMTEWNALGYEKISALQQAMANEVLARLDLKNATRVLDLGCGNGKITAEIARRLPHGAVLGVDASSDMITFARDHFTTAAYPNLNFQVTDIRNLAFRGEFDTVVSFNALHWIPDQAAALHAIHRAMCQSGCAQLRLVPKGQRKSLEDVLEETRRLAKWANDYHGFHDPYLHMTAEDYAALAEAQGLRVESQDVEDKAWDFGSREGFFAFGSVTFVEWLRRLPEEAKPGFIADVLERYAGVAGDDHTFRFYQMNIRLSKD
jgi:trans-aconitate 2-methyltransferase